MTSIEFDQPEGGSKIGAFEIDSFTFNPEQATQTRGQAQTRAQVHDLVFTKRRDFASIALMQCLLSGARIPQAVLTVFKSNRSGPITPYLTFTMKGVIVTAVHFQSRNSGMQLTDDVSLSFESLERKF